MPLALHCGTASCRTRAPDGRHSANRKINRPSLTWYLQEQQRDPTAGTSAGSPAVPCAKKGREKGLQLYWLQSSAGAAAEKELQSNADKSAVAGCAKTGGEALIKSLRGLAFSCWSRITGDYMGADHVFMTGARSIK